MNRREAVRRVALLMGMAMIGSEVFLRGETVPDKAVPPFTDADRQLLDLIGETIIPATDIPGVKGMNIGAFLTMMVNDCYSEKQHQEFAAGLVKINAASTAKYGGPFAALTPAQRTDLLNAIDAEQKQRKDGGDHYFRMMKELVVLGYFSSEIGATQAVKYIEVPGAYHGDVPYKKGDRAWFS
jgi:hypothetical protein